MDGKAGECYVVHMNGMKDFYLQLNGIPFDDFFMFLCWGVLTEVFILYTPVHITELTHTHVHFFPFN